MKRTYLAIIAALALAGALVFLSGCGRVTKISSILQSPEKYLDHKVSIGGEVTKTYAVDLFIAEAGAYQVDDGTGKIWVITRTGVPKEGTKVGLKGTVASGIKLGRELLGAVIREEERRVR